MYLSEVPANKSVCPITIPVASWGAGREHQDRVREYWVINSRGTKGMVTSKVG